jgi:hypothetical protein
MGLVLKFPVKRKDVLGLRMEFEAVEEASAYMHLLEMNGFELYESSHLKNDFRR